ncbi:MAG: DNA methyltransferase [Chloroflexota bacterium]
MLNFVEDDFDIRTVNFFCIPAQERSQLAALQPNTFDVAVLLTQPSENKATLPFRYNPAIHEPFLNGVYDWLKAINPLMSKTGILYIYGLQQWLPYFSVYLDNLGWYFKYWLALEVVHPAPTEKPMINTHEGILLYVHNKNKFNIRKVRSPHSHCDVCGDFTADWGGKKDQRHPLGYAISDVWDDLPRIKDEHYTLSPEVWQRLIMLAAQNGSNILCANYDGLTDLEKYILE